MSMFDLTGKVAIVTGSTKGIGRASVETLAEQGAKVVVSSRKQDACDAVAGELNERFGAGTAIAVAANISDKAALERLVAETRAAFGRIDVLVCNAATNPYYGPMGGISDDQFRKILDNNILSNHWLIQLCAPEMIERGSGSIVVISSIGGLRGTPVIGAYGISKAADMALVRNLAHEFGPSGVRVNCIAPGLIKTDFARALWEDEAATTKRFAATPLRRIGEAHEIAGAVAFLSSPAASYMTGQTIVIDGGIMI